MLTRANLLLLGACLVLPVPAAAQQAPPLVESYARMTALVAYMTGYVGEILLACAAKNVLIVRHRLGFVMANAGIAPGESRLPVSQRAIAQEPADGDAQNEGCEGKDDVHAGNISRTPLAGKRSSLPAELGCGLRAVDRELSRAETGPPRGITPPCATYPASTAPSAA